MTEQLNLTECLFDLTARRCLGETKFNIASMFRALSCHSSSLVLF